MPGLPSSAYYHHLRTTIICVLPSSACYHHLRAAIICVLPSSACYHHLRAAIICVLPSSACYHHLRAAIICVLPSSACYHHLRATIICVLPSSACCHHLRAAIICVLPSSACCHHLRAAIICVLPSSVCCHHLRAAIIRVLPSSACCHHLRAAIICVLPSSACCHHLRAAIICVLPSSACCPAPFMHHTSACWHCISIPSCRSIYQATQEPTLGNKAQPGANVAIIQLTVWLPAVVDFVFLSGLPAASSNHSPSQQAARRLNLLSGPALARRMGEADAAVERRMEASFPVAPELAEKIPGVGDAVKAALSNLIGGMGYFHGRSRIAIPPHLKDPSDPAAYWHYWAAALFTATPSRPMFPRGFLWDEGFHQLTLRRWDERMAMDAVGHWLDLLNADGWIPREQILGDEAR
ncbi:unnamed protein product, partial [Closterium sp. NIES-54]